MIRKLAVGVLVLVAVVIVLGGAVVGISFLSYSRDMHIDSAKGINEAGYIKIGGIDQWIQIRGQDRNNPVLLWLNGGPGFSTIPSTYAYLSWERHFTVVMWDQRGEGKTFARSGTSVAKTMTIAQMTSDGIEVAEYLRKRMQKDKVILLGHSWGSQLGVHMIHDRPDLFSAYVGTGQVTNLTKQAEASYPLLIERARTIGNEVAEQQLIDAGPPPYGASLVKWIPWVSWGNDLDPAPPNRSLPSGGALWLMAQRIFALRSLPPGAQFSQVALWREMIADDLPSFGLKLDTPVVFIQGTKDILTVTAIAKDYFDSIEAPSKKFVLLPNAGHLAIFTARDPFLKALITHIRPLAMSRNERGDS